MFELAKAVIITPFLACLLSKVNATLYLGHDISSLPMLEANGQKYYLNGTPKKFDAIIQSTGANYIRSRIWVNPSNGDYNLAYNLALAKRANGLGLKFYLDFHYSGMSKIQKLMLNEKSLSNQIKPIFRTTRYLGR